jgi:molybdate transport system substrate-binding protein
MRQLFFAVCLLFALSSYAGDKLTIAAASDLRYAMADIVSLFQQQNQHSDPPWRALRYVFLR